MFYIVLLFLLTAVRCSPMNIMQMQTGVIFDKIIEAANASCPGPPNICLTPGCVHAASTMLKSIDQSVDPCDDFYSFACGGYLSSTTIPESVSQVTRFTEVHDSVQAKLRSLMEQPIQDNELPALKMTKIFYQSCIDTEQIKKLGLTEINELLQEFGGWPVLDSNWRPENFDWKQAVYKGRELGLLHLLFEFGTMTDLNNSSKRISGFDIPKFGLPTNFMVMGADSIFIKAYYQTMVEMAVAMGADRAQAMEQLKQSLDFEIQLAKMTIPPEKRRNTTVINNVMTPADLQRLHPSVPWLEIINKHLQPEETLAANEDIIVVDLPYIAAFVDIIAKTDKRIVANYFGFRAVWSAADYLAPEIRDLQLQFKNQMFGLKAEPARWKHCLTIVTNYMAAAVGALYARNFFDESSKMAALDMVADIKAAFDGMLDEVNWMDETTRARAKKKLEVMSNSIGYPEELLNDALVEDQYTGLKIVRGSYLKNALQSVLLTVTQSNKRLRRLVAEDAWVQDAEASKVNAFYKSQTNSIYFPAGILQGVFFGKERPHYMNYGAIGSVIGHELTHGFDDQGKQFDWDGNLRNWWEPETQERYLNKAKCIIEQYGNAVVEEVGMKINGVMTQGENIADNGGFKESYLGYQRWLEKNEEEGSLPGLNYTSDQLFWMASAGIWCRVETPESIKASLVTGVHSPAKFRVNLSFANSPYFAKSWNCKRGSKMNPVDKCTVW